MRGMPERSDMPTYKIPGEVNITHRRAEASRRRQALVTGGCATYTVGSRGGQTAIVCLCCGLGSSHPKDIQEKYCGFCQAWHNEWKGAV